MISVNKRLDSDKQSLCKKMSLGNYLTFCIFVSLVTEVVPSVFYAADLPSDCSGTLVVHGNSDVHKFTTSVETLGSGILAGRVVMEGCGCYILYQGPRRMGRAHFISRSGDHTISFGRIGSVYREECGNKGHRNANTSMMVIGLALGLIFFAVGGWVCVRRRRNMYKEVLSDSVHKI